MNGAAGKFVRKYGTYLGLVLGVVLSILALFIAYDRKRSATLDIGSPGDSPFLSGFYADEPDIDFRYRWTKTEAQVEFKGAGDAPVYSVFVAVQGPRLESTAPPITASLKLNGLVLEPTVITLTDQLETYVFSPTDLKQIIRTAPPYRVSIQTNGFQPVGDSRVLGVKVNEIGLRQGLLGNLVGNNPPLDVIFWLLVLVVGLCGIFTVWRFGVPIAGLASIALTYFTFNNQSLLPAVYLPFVAALAGLIGLLIWRRRDVARLMTEWGKVRGRLVDFVSARVGEDGAWRAKWAMLAAMVLFAGLALWTIPQVSWIGHADYAENANVARSFIQGHGLSVDYSAQFYQSRPELTHPAETWPLLQPLVIAPFFAVLGAQTWVAKLPNLFILLALVWGVFVVGSRLWDARVGLIAGIFTLLHSYFFNSVLYPINDLAFTAIFFALAWMVWRWIVDQQEVNASQSTSRLLHYVAIGVLGGLLVWSKPSGAILLVGPGIWVLWGWWQRKRPAKQEDKARVWQVPWKGLIVAGGAFVIVLLPLIGRNLLAFHSPFYSTEGYDAWILRYYPFYEWENIYKYYIGSELPHIRWIVGGKFGYANLFDAIGLNFQWVWTKGVMGGVASSEFVIGPFALLGAIFGGIVASKRALRAAGMALFSIALYGVFVLLYWHFEGRYFQVAIPWLYLLLAGAVVAVGDVVGKLLKGVGGKVAGGVVAAGLTVALVWSHVYSIGNFLVYDTRPTSFTVAMDWLSANSTADDVVMTRDPWELNWYTQRRAVMIPFDDIATISKVARDSGVTMLQLGGPTDGLDVATCPDKGDGSRFPTGSRPALGKLYCGFEMPGYTLVYKNGDLTIYRLSR